MKKIQLFTLIIGLLAVLAACGTADQEESNTGDEQETTNEETQEDTDTNLYEQIQEDGVITVGTEGTYAPFTFHDEEDNLTGYDVEVMREVASRLDLEVEFNETQWDSMFAGLNAGRFDVIANQVGINEERLEKYDFSEPYTYTGAVVVVPADNEEVTSFEDIEGKQSAQSLTSNFNDIAEENGAEVIGVEGLAQAIENIKLGRVDLTVNDRLAVLEYINQTGDESVKIAAEEDNVSKTAFAFRKGNEELVEAFNEALAEMKEDGTLAEISEEWFGEDVSSQ
ncbi:amino acid ABC transporter substrate-binding protein [Gracilibacillus thailandensis]|jgi:L-cystine transport system substrate-binding protein|uniref:Transporter substrate-binding domain-containing protein n=1 Tax=Gracilibacillus thailandensis TaxID=563735 RepID=A0A6N7QS46_9BACI|nr:amino acid ABC transporter substrate-binding protein [Gracilibacillus thailandensis]MRI64927.1 transporter substrate-binding domain-containing protein [Gracilibacillus thailandensis]